MADRLLAFFVVMGPTAFALVLEIVDERIRKHRFWKYGTVAFGLILSGCTWWQMERQEEASSGAQEAAIERVASETSQRVTEAVGQQYQSLITELAQQFQQLGMGIRTYGARAHRDSETISGALDALRQEASKQTGPSGLQPVTPPSSSASPSVPAFPRTPVASSAPPEDTQALKDQGLQLAKEINDWISAVSQEAPNSEPVQSPGGPPVPPVFPTPEERAAQSSYVDLLNTEWNAKFAGRATSMVNLLHVQGILLACRRGSGGPWYDNPTSILAFRKTCANSIERTALGMH